MSVNQQSTPPCPDYAPGARETDPAGDGGDTLPGLHHGSMSAEPFTDADRAAYAELCAEPGGIRTHVCTALTELAGLAQANGGDPTEVTRGALAFLRAYDVVPPTRIRSEDQLVRLAVRVEALLHAFRGAGDAQAAHVGDVELAVEFAALNDAVARLRAVFDDIFAVNVAPAAPANVHTAVTHRPGGE